MPFPLTDEQRKIVDDRGGELLVSAAAGSGKTRVLVERLLDRVAREEVDIDRFLVITYTRAAAAELRGRIAQELSDRLARTPNDRHLRRQATLVYRTQISTVHAFCAALLRENGHVLDLDPDFRLCDEGEGQALMLQVLEEVLDRRYEDLTEESPFAQLVDTLSAGRDDSRLAQITVDIFARVQSHPDPARWLEAQKELWRLEGVSDLSQTVWGAPLLEDAHRRSSAGRGCFRLWSCARWTSCWRAITLPPFPPPWRDWRIFFGRTAGMGPAPACLSPFPRQDGSGSGPPRSAPLKRSGPPGPESV